MAHTFSQLSDGRFWLVEHDGDEYGPLAIWNPEEDSVEIVQDCVAPEEDFWPEDYVQGFKCDNGDLFYGRAVIASADGRFLAGMGYDPDGRSSGDQEPAQEASIRIWDVETLDVVTTFPVAAEISFGANDPLSHFGDGWILAIDGEPGNLNNVIFRVFDAVTGATLATLDEIGVWRESRAVSRDGTRLYVVEENGQVWEYDTTTWESTRTWSAQNGRARGIALSPGGSRLAVSGEDGVVVIWDLDALILVDRIPAPRPSDVMWIDDARMAIAVLHGPGRTEWRVVDLSARDVASAAREGLVRSFTREECATYLVDPCPTLEEIKAGS